METGTVPDWTPVGDVWVEGLPQNKEELFFFYTTIILRNSIRPTWVESLLLYFWESITPEITHLESIQVYIRHRESFVLFWLLRLLVYEFRELLDPPPAPRRVHQSLYTITSWTFSHLAGPFLHGTSTRHPRRVTVVDITNLLVAITPPRRDGTSTDMRTQKALHGSRDLYTFWSDVFRYTES